MQNHGDDKGLRLELDSDNSAADETVFDDVGVEDELDDSMGVAHPAPQKSRGKAKLMAGVVVAGVLAVGGYVGYLQVAGQSAQPVAAVPGDIPAMPLDGTVMADGAQPLPMDGAVPLNDPAFAAPAPLDPFAPPADGGMIDPALGGIVPPPAPGMPEAVAADGGFVPPPADGLVPPGVDPAVAGLVVPDAQDVAATTPAQDPQIPPAAPVADVSPFDVPVDAPVMPEPQRENAVAPIVEAPVATPVVTPAVDTAVLDELRTHINTLESRIGDLQRELDAVRKQKAEQAPVAREASDVTKADLKALERRIDALATKTVATTASRPAPVAAPVAVAPVPVIAPAPVAQVPVSPRPTTMVPSTATIQTAVDGGKVSSAPAPQPTPLLPSAATGTWQLRSAQPGRAWIAKPGSQEMRAVALGEEVEGLGRILSIAQGADGRWMVRGTLGSVAQ